MPRVIEVDDMELALQSVDVGQTTLGLEGHVAERVHQVAQRLGRCWIGDVVDSQRPVGRRNEYEVACQAHALVAPSEARHTTKPSTVGSRQRNECELLRA